MTKRLLDICFSLCVLTTGSPVILLFMLLVWLQDGKSPFYMAPRVGKGGRSFWMLKLRSMISGADKTGVCSTSTDDERITALGHVIRRFKLDELTQFVNVLKGEMSVVGPRPQVNRDVELYTEVEKMLLLVKPGITDFSSIVFADEGEILKDSRDPDGDYNRMIRPWKSRLGLFYVDRMSFPLDVKLIALTALTLVSRRRALSEVCKILEEHGAGEKLRRISLRKDRLAPATPPGSA